MANCFAECAQSLIVGLVFFYIFEVYCVVHKVDPPCTLLERDSQWYKLYRAYIVITQLWWRGSGGVSEVLSHLLHHRQYDHCECNISTQSLILGYTVLFLVIHSCYLQAPAESSAKCLRADWIWDSLKQKHQLPIESYLVS